MEVMKGLIKKCKPFFRQHFVLYEATVRIFCLNEVAVIEVVALTILLSHLKSYAVFAAFVQLFHLASCVRVQCDVLS